MLTKFFNWGRRKQEASEDRVEAHDAASDSGSSTGLPAMPPDQAGRLPQHPSFVSPPAITMPDLNRAALFSVSRRSQWAPVEPPRKFMTNVQRASAELRFDIENKCKFATRFRDEIENHLKAPRSAPAGYEKAVAFLNFCRDRLHDYEHVLTLDDFQQSKSALSELSISERRRIENFYSDFFVAVRGLQRVLFQRWPEAEEMRRTDPAAVEAMLTDTMSQIEGLSEAIDDFLAL
ncbi:MAG: hypothetical protein R3C60_04380 [Parvularculaceae bacterium]